MTNHRLTLITGPAGVGKSTYGQILAEQTSSCLLDSDTVTEQLVKAGMGAAGLDPDDRDSPEYRRYFRDPVYEVLFQTAAENLVHLDVIIVGPFTREIQNSEWPAELSKRFGCEVEIVFVTCDETTRHQRVINRANPRDQWKLTNWNEYLAKSSVKLPACAHRVVET
ncbi:MAG: AAA family ATPase [Akkermansiaceae bacterium]